MRAYLVPGQGKPVAVQGALDAQAWRVARKIALGPHFEAHPVPKRPRVFYGIEGPDLRVALERLCPETHLLVRL